MIRGFCRAALLSSLVVLAISCSVAAVADTLALRGGNLYASPDADAVADAVVVVSDGVITAVGKSNEVQVPADARVIDCTGKTIVAGFWNSHVHFTEPVWKTAEDGPAAPLTSHMQAMLTRWGFTTVWSLGSNVAATRGLRRRVSSGEVLGPDIFFAGSIFPADGHPAYLPPEMQLPQTATPEASEAMARQYLAESRLDGIKLFTGVYKGEGKPVVNMDVPIAKAAVDVAHAQGKPVFAHPQNTAGIEAVIAAGST